MARTARLEFRIDTAELEQIEVAAKTAGVNVSAFVRGAALESVEALEAASAPAGESLRPPPCPHPRAKRRPVNPNTGYIAICDNCGNYVR